MTMFQNEAATGVIFTYISKRQYDFATSCEFYFCNCKSKTLVNISELTVFLSFKRYSFAFIIENQINISCADPENFVRVKSGEGIQTNTTISGPSTAHQGVSVACR